MANDPIKNLSTDSAYFRDRYRKTMSFLLVLTGLAIVLLVTFIVVSKVKHQQKFYATTMSGKVIPLQALSMPVVTNDFVLKWAALAVRSAYNLDFVKYQSQLAGVEKYFTDPGWKSFQSALDNAGVIDTIKKQKLVTSAVITGPVILDNIGVFDGRYMWKLHMPLLITYGSASDAAKQRLVVSMIVMRVPALDSAEGIQINNIDTSGAA